MKEAGRHGGMENGVCIWGGDLPPPPTLALTLVLPPPLSLPSPPPPFLPSPVPLLQLQLLAPPLLFPPLLLLLLLLLLVLLLLLALPPLLFPISPLLLWPHMRPPSFVMAPSFVCTHPVL